MRKIIHVFRPEACKQKMAEDDICRLCHEKLSKKQRRTIFGDTFNVMNQLVEVLGYVPHSNDGLTRYVCAVCYAKLNKLSKIDYDIVHRLDALRNEKIELIKLLRTKYLTACGPFQSPVPLSPGLGQITPVGPGSKKRLILHSPTPRKVKQSMFETKRDCRSICSTSASEELGCVPMSPLAKPINVKTRLFSSSKVKVQSRSIKGDRLRTTLIPKGDFQKIVKSIARGDSEEKVGRTAYNTSLKQSIQTCMLKEMEKELSSVTSRNIISPLRQIDSKSLTTFSFDRLNLNIQTQAPLFYKTISTVVKDSNVGKAVTSAISLRFRNSHLTALHHTVGQILDCSGATDEAISILNKLGLCVSTTSVNMQKKKLQARQMEHIKKLMNDKNEFEENAGTVIDYTACSSDIGDNIDITRNVSQMSKDRRRKSWHWFLLVGLEKRVISPNVDDIFPTKDILRTDNSLFLPSLHDCQILEEHFIFHIMHVLVKYVDCLKKYSTCLPKNIMHPHIQETSKKSDFAILDLLDKSENKSEDMISILEYIHNQFVPHSAEENASVIKKRVFGGDVLTNERAYSAQLAMLNGDTDYDRLAGVIHRPEGLHRMMNLLLIIYQNFYKASSATDLGTLYQLRNVIGRIDVHGPDEVIQKYRAHYSFVEDCLDGFIVGSCMDLLDLAEINSDLRKPQPLFDVIGNEARYQYIYNIAKEILEKYVKVKNDLPDIYQKTVELDVQENTIKDMFDHLQGKYEFNPCNKKYKTIGRFKLHFSGDHQWVFISDKTDDKSKLDSIAMYRSSFMKCALLLRDLNDAYKKGDGDRIMDDAKFQMLLSDIGGHTKYQLWLLRFLAYFHVVLPPTLAYEYKWNCTANIHGGLNQNIPNDNLVEILVQTIKKKVQSQGANATYESARKAAMTTQVQDEIKENMEKMCGKKQSGHTRPNVIKPNDIVAIVNELRTVNAFKYVMGREYCGFPGFKDMFSRVNTVELHKWITKEKERISYEMI